LHTGRNIELALLASLASTMIARFNLEAGLVKPNLVAPTQN